MADTYHEVGRLEGLEGSDIVVGVDGDRVVINYGPPLTLDQMEQLARLLVRATWEAGMAVPGHG